MERRIPAKRIEIRRTEVLTDGGPQTRITAEVSTTYYVYSTVLGGAKIHELNESGLAFKGYVYVNGQRLAEQDWSVAVFWHHANPGTGSWVETDYLRQPTRKEMDPIGAELGTTDPFQVQQVPTYLDLKGSEPLFIEGGDPFDFSGGHEIDGMPVSDSEFNRRTGNGSVTVQRTDSHGSRGYKECRTTL